MTLAVSTRALGAAVAIFISYSSILSIGYGLFGMTGNTTITGCVLASTLIAMFLLSIRTYGGLLPTDLLFCSLVMALAVSSIYNTDSAALSVAFNNTESVALKEFLLLTATFSAYVSCRSISIESLHGLLPSFKRAAGIIVATGAALTLAALLGGAGEFNRPVILDFGGLPLQLMTPLGLLILAFVTSDDPSPRRTAAISAATFVAVAIFAAAMVRFAFAALIASMVLAALLTEKHKRWHVAAVTLAILVGIGVGLITRADTARIYVGRILEAVTDTPTLGFAATPLDPAGPCANVNINDSVQIRKFLAQEALERIPSAGLIGTGLDSFSRSSCLVQHQVHNSILQMVVEFGWLAGAIFVTLIGLAFVSILPMARQRGPIRFVLCSLVFAILMSLAHGRVSRDGVLFALIGCAVGVSGTVSRLQQRKISILG